jgi:hypothetical protein
MPTWTRTQDLASQTNGWDTILGEDARQSDEELPLTGRWRLQVAMSSVCGRHYPAAPEIPLTIGVGARGVLQRGAFRPSELRNQIERYHRSHRVDRAE